MAITYEPIATTTLASATTTISFTSISSSYTDLVLRVSGSVANDANIYIKLNNASSGMGWGRIRQNTRGGTPQQINSTSPATYMNIGFLSGNDPFACIIDINAYTSTNTYKQILSRNFSVNRNNYGAGGWISTAAVNRVDFITDENMAIGTKATLFGILRA
jgi:hypothetical protein